MKAVYPVLIKQYGKDHVSYVPDLEINTEGKTLYDAIEMTRDAIGAWCTGESESDENVPLPSTGEDAVRKARANADGELDFSDGILTYVDIDTDEYRRRVLNRSVKKNCTIPYWLNEKAERLGVNFSRVLQEALIGIIEGQ
ncbi:MAG: type II toxin-antitoxin system HicB family antitoxin [Mogibacterium sp.]|nr:type II toxin-antitoxin system HicB family antitoxin [Mogibacterium sp.]MBR2539227.1 type II toxin-antitoxin system HicB family antitoxin [Mogibacterium sp.]